MLKVEKVRGGEIVLKFAGLAKEAEPTELCSCDEIRMYCTERRNLGRQLKAMKVHHHSGGHLCISASLTQTKALQRNNPPMQENSALILFGGKSSMSSFALQASG